MIKLDLESKRELQLQLPVNRVFKHRCLVMVIQNLNWE